MLDVTTLLCRDLNNLEHFRYSERKKPVIVWNTTRMCNLKCIHCYIEAKPVRDEEELTTSEASEMIIDLARYKIPVILFSGGEPLLREDIFALGKLAFDSGIKAVLSTNGTLITPEIACKIKESGFAYVGVSLDGTEFTNDSFRGEEGAYKKAVEGIKNCQKAGIKTGIRFTLSRKNLNDLEKILNLLPELNVTRGCIYHLVSAGRASLLTDEILEARETRAAVDLIFNKAVEFYKINPDIEILTVDNHADGVYLYLKLLKENPERAKKVYELLSVNGGNNSGVGIACIDYKGDIHPDQFWMSYSLGNLRKHKFADIWLNPFNSILMSLRDRKKLLKGKCKACRFLPLCNGNLRARAINFSGDPWDSDPACYLKDEETS